MRRVCLLLVLVVLPFALACPGFGSDSGDLVVASPVYDPDVKAILDQHCVLCHGVPQHNGAPDYFRLDQYQDTVVGSGTAATIQYNGVGYMGCLIRRRAVLGDPTFMPPANQNQPPLAPGEKETIDRWAQQGRREFVTDTEGLPCAG